MTPGTILSFAVVGRVPPKGSARSFALKKGGRYTGKTVTVQQNAEALADWKARCGLAARSAGVELLAEAWQVEMCVRVPRPKAHYRGGRLGADLKPTAPPHPTGKPDADKLLRSLLDALTGIAWPDDSYVVSAHAHKRYGEEHVATVHLRTLR